MISRFLFALLLFAFASAHADVPCRTAGELARTFSKGAATSRPFDLTARISYVRDDLLAVVIGIEDATGAAIAEVPYALFGDRRPRPGDLVRLLGVAGPDAKGLHVAEVSRITTLAHGDPPLPTDARLSKILGGELDFRLTRFSGVLRDATASETASGWTILALRDADGQVFASVPDAPGFSFDSLIGRRVQLTGIPVPHDKSNRKYLTPVFKVASARDVVLADGDSPVRDLGSIRFRRVEDLLSLERHRATGRVIAVWLPRQALLETDSGAFVGLEFMTGSLPAYGDRIEAVGLPESDLFNINLDHVTYESAAPADRTLGPARRISARTVIGADGSGTKIDSTFHGRTLRLSGTVRSIPGENGGRLLLESDNLVVPVDASACPDALASITRDCRIDVSGVCVMEQNERRQTSSLPQIKGFFLVVRTSADILVLSRPSWWTPMRLWTLFGVLLAALLGVLVWNASLRKVAARKGRELMREQLGHVKAELKTEERTRLAVELHDSLAQNLTGVSLEIDTAAKVADEDPVAMKTHLGVAARSLKSCRDELRNCLWDLRNRALEERTMDEAIRQTLTPHVAGVDVAIRFNVPRERISDSTAHAILRIVRELTLNGIRHGGATRIWIAGSIEDDRMLFSVRDNGRGFEPETAPGFAEGHYGLLGIRERIDEFEGEFTLKSSPGKGTKAMVALKVPQET